MKKQKSDERCIEILSRYFSPGVVHKMTMPQPPKRIIWSPDDIRSAISLRATGIKTYKYLRNHMHVPLPSPSVLKRWARKLNLSPGLLSGVLELMRKKVATMTEKEKLCVISFDEMHVSQTVVFDKKEEQVIGPHKKVQDVHVRGLMSAWKQVIFYDFDRKMDPELLRSMIKSLRSIGLRVVATVCDCGGDNRKLCKDLEVTPEKPFFHAAEDQKVFFFYDVPHLLKNLRNHFIEEGYINGQTVSKRCLVKILDRIKEEEAKGNVRSDLQVAYKLSDDLLDVSNLQRQNVGKAAKLFSHTNAKALRFYDEHKLIDDDSSKAVADFLQDFNDWFDLLNSVDKYSSYCGSDEQKAFLARINEKVRVIWNITKNVDSKYKALLPFQVGMLITNNALQGLLPMVQELLPNEDVTYIMTRRLNQDIVENFFSHMRGMFAFNEHPDPLDYKSRLRWYILGKNPSVVTDAVNTRIDTLNNASLVSVTELQRANSNDPETTEAAKKSPLDLSEEKIPLTPELFDDIIDCGPMTKQLLGSLFTDDGACSEWLATTELEVNEEIEDLDVMEETSQSPVSIYKEAREFLAGYVANAFKKKHPELGQTTSRKQEAQGENKQSWIEFLSKGHLRVPSEELKKAVEVADDKFLEYHGLKELRREPKVFQTVLHRTKEVLGQNQIKDSILLKYIRTRTFIRLRTWNNTLWQTEREQNQAKKQATKSSKPSAKSQQQSKQLPPKGSAPLMTRPSTSVARKASRKVNKYKK